MINTVVIKEQQLRNGYFESGSGSEKVLIMGSCRTAPYVFYLDEWNKGIGNNRFTIYAIDPFNWHYHPLTNERVDIHEVIKGFETDDRMLNMFASVDVFIHEYYKNYGCFNIFKGDGDKNIYDYGMSPIIDIMIPSFNDVFILFNDHYKFDAQFRESANSDYKMYGQLSGVTQEWIRKKTEDNLDKFYDVCHKSSYPQMATLVSDNIKSLRFMHNFNHVSRAFTLWIFRFLQKDIKIENWEDSRYIDYWDNLHTVDMFDSDSTPLTEYDVEVFGFNWGESIVSFKEYNKIGQ